MHSSVPNVVRIFAKKTTRSTEYDPDHSETMRTLPLIGTNSLIQLNEIPSTVLQRQQIGTEFMSAAPMAAEVCAHPFMLCF